jgi:hypothetical protein
MKSICMMTIALSALALPVSAQDLNLALQCDGVETFDTTVSVPGQDGGAPVIRNDMSRQFERVQIIFEGTGGRVRMPDVPGLRGSSGDGWRPLNNVAQAGDLITARFSYDFLDHPSVRIDRTTGGIEISSLAARFVGECQPYDASARRF